MRVLHTKLHGLPRVTDWLSKLLDLEFKSTINSHFWGFPEFGCFDQVSKIPASKLLRCLAELLPRCLAPRWLPSTAGWPMSAMSRETLPEFRSQLSQRKGLQYWRCLSHAHIALSGDDSRLHPDWLGQLFQPLQQQRLTALTLPSWLIWLTDVFLDKLRTRVLNSQ